MDVAPSPSSIWTYVTSICPTSVRSMLPRFARAVSLFKAKVVSFITSGCGPIHVGRFVREYDRTGKINQLLTRQRFGSRTPLIRIRSFKHDGSPLGQLKFTTRNDPPFPSQGLNLGFFFSETLNPVRDFPQIRVVHIGMS